MDNKSQWEQDTPREGSCCSIPFRGAATPLTLHQSDWIPRVAAPKIFTTMPLIGRPTFYGTRTLPIDGLCKRFLMVAFDFCQGVHQTDLIPTFLARNSSLAKAVSHRAGWLIIYQRGSQLSSHSRVSFLARTDNSNGSYFSGPELQHGNRVQSRQPETRPQFYIAWVDTRHRRDSSFAMSCLGHRRDIGVEPIRASPLSGRLAHRIGGFNSCLGAV